MSKLWRICRHQHSRELLLAYRYTGDASNKMECLPLMSGGGFPMKVIAVEELETVIDKNISEVLEQLANERNNNGST